MKKNKTTASFDGPAYVQENYPANDTGHIICADGLWMEFEDSFIRVLSGAEPFRKYYQASEIEQLHLA